MRHVLISLLLAGGIAAGSRAAAEPPSIPDTIQPTDWLVLTHPGPGQRQPFFIDRITAAIVRGDWTPPHAGDAVLATDGERHSWQAVTIEPGKTLEHAALKGGWALTRIRLDRPRRAILRAIGHSIVYVNGTPRVANHYRYGYVMIPILLRAGENELLFRAGRGTLKVTLEPVTHDVMVNMADATLPEAVAGGARTLDAGIVVLNTTTHPIDLADSEPINAETAAGDAVPAVHLTPRWMAPLSIAKVPARLPAVRADSGTIRYRVAGSPGGPGRLSRQEATFEIPVRRPDEFRKVTFVSAIDDSVQYYALRPRIGPPVRSAGGLMLHVHGAGDEAAGYRNLYFAKNWVSIVGATNRRPFGFDWEDWGRLDAIEVLDHATRLLKPDPSRIYLGGHSMGGHGVWQLGVHYPDRFAAIGPGASWPDFWSYGGEISYENPTPVQALLDRCANPSRTKLLLRNCLHFGVFIIHGDADQVVPFALAKDMYKRLKKFHHDVTLHVQPGGGHVYDATPEVGKDCFDLMELFEFFQRHARPLAPRLVEFVTTCPGVNASCHWVTIEQQQRLLQPSRVKLQIDPGRRVLFGTTENVRRLTLAPAQVLMAGPLTLQLDKSPEIKLEYRREPIYLSREGTTWKITTPPDPGEKGPHRYGLFKNAFDHHVVLVVGTAGNDEENAWALAKARFDSETFWYRGNGSFNIVLDRDFDPQAQPDHNVVLYGNADTNRAWAALLRNCPIQIRRGTMRVGEETFTGDDLGCLMIRPRPGSNIACVGVVGGTGPAGMRATDRLSYFVSGIAYPDWIVFRAAVWERGDAAVEGAGLFDLGWSLSDTDTAWSKTEHGE